MTLVGGAMLRISLQRRHALADAFGVRRQAEVLQHHRRLEAAQLRQRLAARAARSAPRARRSTT